MATGLNKRPVAGQTSIRTEGSSKCSIHRNKKVVFVCRDCNELICTTCCVSGHRNHVLGEIEEVNLQQRGKLRDFVNDAEENKLPELRNELKSIEEKVSKTDHNLGTFLPGQIQQHRKLCKTEIDSFISQLKSSLQEKRRENIALLQAYKNEIQRRYNDLALVTEECKQILQSGTSVLVYDKVKAVKCLKTEPLSMPVLRTLEYKPGSDFSQKIKHAIGTIDTGSPDNPITGILRQFKRGKVGEILPKEKLFSYSKRLVEFGCVLSVLVLIWFVALDFVAFYIGTNCAQKSKLAPTHDGSVWFLDGKTDLILISNDGTTKRISKDQWNILDISLSSTDSLLFFSEYDRTIYEMTPPSFSPYPRSHVKSRAAFALQITSKKHLVLGYWRNLRIFTEEGILRHKAADASLWLMAPVQIIECPITGNLAVVRLLVLTPFMSDIAVYDKTLNVLFNYVMPGTGWDSVVSIAYDSFGNIVIGDSRTPTVYMISGRTGQYIKHLFDVKGELSSIAIQTPCNILWAAVQQDIPPNRKGVKIKQRLLDLPNPSDKCKQLRKNVLKTVYKTAKGREREKDFVQNVISYIEKFLFFCTKYYPIPNG